MLKNKILISCYLLFFFSSNSFGENKFEQTIEVSGRQTYYNYDEKIPSEEEGWIPGYHISYKVKTENNIYFKLSYNSNIGETQYTGVTLAGNRLYSNTQNKRKEIEAIFGIPISNDGKTSIYTGYSHHKWHRHIISTSPLLEEYQWEYLILGLRHEFKIDKKWDGAIDLSLQRMTYGEMEVLGGTMVLGNKTGGRIKTEFNYHINENWGIAFTPWYQYSAIGKSNIVPFYYRGVKYGVYEPASRTHQGGIDFGITYTF